MTTTTQQSTGRELFRSLYEEQSSVASQTAWFAEQRAQAMEKFENQGLPGTHLEDWRKTDVGAIGRLGFAWPSQESDAAELKTLIQANRPEELSGPLLVFFNGRFCADLSDTENLPEGLRIMTLSQAMSEELPEVIEHLAQHADLENPFTALNTALFQEGYFIHLAENVELSDAIQIIFISSAQTSNPAISQLRNLVVAESGSRMNVIETWVATEEDAVYFSNTVTECVLGIGTKLQHDKMQFESLGAYHFSRIQAHQERDSHFQSQVATLGAKLSRNDLGVMLADEGCESVLNGIYLGSDRQLHDTHSRMNHAKPNCNSHELYKGIMDDNSNGVFCGAIMVEQDAQKTNAIQSSKVLLLDDNASTTSMPQLEIFADDVKCTHGSTTGELDPMHTLYMQSRGIGRTEARRMLTFAFANEVIEEFASEAVRDLITQRVELRLEQSNSLKA